MFECALELALVLLSLGVALEAVAVDSNLQRL